MTKAITLIAMVAAAAAATGCQSIQQAIGATKVAPDEFRVVTTAPLTLPPDYSLRPPRPGEPRPQEMEPGAEARAAIFGQDVGQGASPGERALVAGAGAEAADPNARDQVDFEGAGIVHRGEDFSDRVLANEATARPIDETRRLEEEEAIRRATGGGEVIIERGERGFKLPGT